MDVPCKAQAPAGRVSLTSPNQYRVRAANDRVVEFAAWVEVLSGVSLRVCEYSIGLAWERQAVGLADKGSSR